MRGALWLMALFAMAVASALFAGDNRATITLFWPPQRVDLSLNLFLLLLAGVFVTVHLALRALAALVRIPQQAQRWRLQQRERAMFNAMLDSFAHLVAGRFVRARKAAELAVTLEQAIADSGEVLAAGARVRALSHLLAAEAAHALQDGVRRDTHGDQALHASEGSRELQEAREGVQLRRARWALEAHDPKAALGWLDQLSQGAARRTLALRLRFRAARQAGQLREALGSARLLTKHRAFSAAVGSSIARSVGVEMLESARDAQQVQRAWEALERTEQALPELACAAAERLLALDGDVEQARAWLTPLWELMERQPDALSDAQRLRLVKALELGFARGHGSASDAQWLARIETLQRQYPADGALQYLAGVVCMHMALWGKAHQLLKQSLLALPHGALRRDGWIAVARVAEQRQDAAAAASAYREAAREAVLAGDGQRIPG